MGLLTVHHVIRVAHSTREALLSIKTFPFTRSPLSAYLNTVSVSQSSINLSINEFYPFHMDFHILQMRTSRLWRCFKAKSLDFDFEKTGLGILLKFLLHNCLAFISNMWKDGDAVLVGFLGNLVFISVLLN